MGPIKYSVDKMLLLFLSLLGYISYVTAQPIDVNNSLPVVEIKQNSNVDNQQYDHYQDWITDSARGITTLKYPNTLSELYLTIGFSQIWEDQRALDDFKQQLKIIHLANVNKVLSSRYKLLTSLNQASDWRKYDVIATDTLLVYLSFIEKLDGSGKMWLFGEKTPSKIKLVKQKVINHMLNSYEQQRFYDFIFGLKPTTAKYTKILRAIEKLEATKTNRWPVFSFQRQINPGQRVPFMANLVTALEILGDMPKSTAAKYRQRGSKVYTGQVVLAIKRFQRRHGLQVDGVIGSQTQKWLALNLRQRIRLLALNAQRLHLWSNNLRTGIIVNIPNYHMNLWLDGKRVLKSRVIVGKPSRQTPLFNTSVKSVVFNPYWNVPNSIMNRDILPKVRRNRSYLSRHNYEVIRSWSSHQKIAINSIPYHLLSPNKFPYRLRQKPGKKNALGRYKFNIPNNQAIFLHDSAYPALFNRHKRALSSGCVRVQESKKLALALLQYSGRNKSQFSQYSRSKKTRTIVLNKGKNIPVELIYQTVWVNDDGIVNYRPDIYKYDGS